MQVSIPALLSLYDSSPFIYVVEGKITTPSVAVPVDVDGASPSPETMNIAFTSLTNVLAEEISRKNENTKEAIVLKEEFFLESAKILNEFVKTSPGKAAELVERWRDLFGRSLTEIASKNPEMSIDDAVVELGEKLRLNSLIVASFISSESRRVRSK